MFVGGILGVEGRKPGKPGDGTHVFGRSSRGRAFGRPGAMARGRESAGQRLQPGHEGVAGAKCYFLRRLGRRPGWRGPCRKRTRPPPGGQPNCVSWPRNSPGLGELRRASAELTTTARAPRQVKNMGTVPRFPGFPRSVPPITRYRVLRIMTNRVSPFLTGILVCPPIHYFPGSHRPTRRSKQGSGKCSLNKR